MNSLATFRLESVSADDLSLTPEYGKWKLRVISRIGLDHHLGKKSFAGEPYRATAFSYLNASFSPHNISFASVSFPALCSAVSSMEVLQPQTNLPRTMVPSLESTNMDVDVDMDMDLGPVEDGMTHQVSFVTGPM